MFCAIRSPSPRPFFAPAPLIDQATTRRSAKYAEPEHVWYAVRRPTVRIHPSTLPEMIAALELYARSYPGELPANAEELARRIDRLPRSAATVLRKYVDRPEGRSLIEGAHSALRAGNGAVSVREAVRVMEAAGKLFQHGATVRNHPSRIGAALDTTQESDAPRKDRPPELPIPPRALPPSANTAPKIIAWLKKNGFSRKDQNGSHQQWEGPTGHKVTVPIHGNERIKRGTLAAISAQIGAGLGRTLVHRP